MIQIHAAVGSAAIVLHLESKRGVRRAVFVCVREELQASGHDVRYRNELTGCYVDAVQLQLAVRRDGGDLHCEERVRGRVVRISKTEVGCRERVRRVFISSNGVVRAGRFVINGCDVNGHRVGRRIKVNATRSRAAVILHLESEACVGSAILIRVGEELQ